MTRTTINRTLDRIGARAAALALLVIPAAGAAQDQHGARSSEAVEAQPATLHTSHVAMDRVVFRQFPDLSTTASRVRLERLRSDRQTAAQLDRVAALLAAGESDSTALAEAMMPLLEGLDEQAAYDTVAAVMLYHYEATVRGTAGSDADARASMEAAARAVATSSLSTDLGRSRALRRL